MRNTLSVFLASAVLSIGVASQANAQALLDPNQASREQLLKLPFFDAALADAVIKGRPYADMLAVDKTIPLNAGQKVELYKQMFLPINLNSAARAEILLIPGVGPKMAHEFEEYRPYKAIEQFRREIGKYVSKDEVARLERYVVIK
jgi:DNA uptake protein ComE-like DNA-binding protein